MVFAEGCKTALVELQGTQNASRVVMKEQFLSYEDNLSEANHIYERTTLNSTAIRELMNTIYKAKRDLESYREHMLYHLDRLSELSDQLVT